MLAKLKQSQQLNFLLPSLREQLSSKHPLYILANQVDWSFFDEHFKKHYREDFGRPALPIRLMVALLILKHLRNLSDESMVEQWSENAYYRKKNIPGGRRRKTLYKFPVIRPDSKG